MNTRSLPVSFVALVTFFTVLVSCSGDDPSSNAATTPVGDAGTSWDMSLDVDTTCTEPRLFGAPTEATGLTAEECSPSCACSSFVAPEFTADQLDALRQANYLGDQPEIMEDPYASADVEEPDFSRACGVLLEQDGYRLESFASLDALTEASAELTHWGDCGACSTLENFAVYAATDDLTGPVRQCGLDNLNDLDGTIACLQGLGFDLPCAQIWAFNTGHTRENCLGECLAALNDPYNLPDGGLNPCLACDERVSGAVFKRVAGRTRRNSGLASALCRPCSEALPVAHEYLNSL